MTSYSHRNTDFHRRITEYFFCVFRVSVAIKISIHQSESISLPIDNRLVENIENKQLVNFFNQSLFYIGQILRCIKIREA